MHENQSRAHGRFTLNAERAESARRTVIEARRAGATHEEAAKRAQVTRMTVNRWMRADLAFAAAVREAERAVWQDRINAFADRYHAARATNAA